MKNRSVMNHTFSDVPKANISRSTFDRSHGVKTTFNGGFLVPIFVDEAMPGDTFNLQTSGIVRLATPLHPTMDNMYLDTFYYAVPIRLVHDNFQKLMGEQDNPGDSVDFVTPKITSPAGGYQENSLFDYLGLPTKIDNITSHSYFNRAYNLIYNEWFRDQNLQDSVVVDKDDGPDDPADYVLLRRGKRHDYFTSCLPWPQKGDAVDLPLGTTAPVVQDGSGNVAPTFNVDGNVTPLQGSTGNNDARFATVATGITNANWSDPNLVADLSSATSATINQLRQAFQIQRMYENDARGGTRYTEIIRSHFAVVSPDARLQRPEYLGGGSTPVNVNPVASTNGGGTPTASGTSGILGGVGTATFNNNGFVKSFTEHCLIIGIANVRADLTYQQGLNRMFSRDDRLDFYWPALSVIGEQAVLNKEIFAQGTNDDEDVFGYQERYAEYRYKPSTIHGLFRSNANETLDSWHLSQDFATLPALSDSFIQDSPPIDRIVRVPSEPDFIGDFYHHLVCARPMPLYGIPGGIDRF